MMLQAWTLNCTERSLCMQVPRIVSLFITTRSLNALVQGTNTANAPALEPVAVDRLLSELRGLLACSQEFASFLQKSAADAVHPRPLPRTFHETLRAGQYAQAAHELQAAYVSLERMYLEQSVAKAIELDSITEVSVVRFCCVKA